MAGAWRAGACARELARACVPITQYLHSTLQSNGLSFIWLEKEPGLRVQGSILTCRALWVA